MHIIIAVLSSSAGVRRAGRRRGMGWVVVLDLEVGLWLRVCLGQRTKYMLCGCFTENFRAVIQSRLQKRVTEAG